MKIQNMDKMIQNFKIKQFCNTIFGFNPHDAIIGEWIRWWLTDSFLGERKKRRVINPAILAKSGRRRAFADIMFAEETKKGSGNYYVVGVGEAENSESNFFKKLENLSVYEQIIKEKERRKFPDLQFALLCIKADAEYQQGKVVLKNADLVNRLRREMREYSKKSRMCWVLYLLRYMKHEDDSAVFIVKGYVPQSDRFWYDYAFCGSEFFIYYKGKLRKHVSYLMQSRFSK